MLTTVRNYAPSTWTYPDTQSDVYSYSEEYKQVENEAKRITDVGFTIKRMIRVQDLHAFGQFLIREQLRIKLDSNQLYRVRRYIQVSQINLDDIIKYNLDPRRCLFGQSSLTFSKNINSFCSNKLIVVVKVLTTEPDKDKITPKNSSDYYVEYIIQI